MISRRLRVLPVMLVLISILVFSLSALAPGSTESAFLAGRRATPEALAAIRQAYHLDEPLPVQYAIWARRAVVFDFGRSLRTRQPVVDLIGDRAGVTGYLGLYAFAITLIGGVGLGMVAALRAGSWIDRTIVAIVVIGISAPAFVSGLLLLYVFAVNLGWFPIFGSGTGFLDRLWHYALPAFALSLTSMALLVKLTRTSMIDAMQQDYVVFARSRGMSRRRVVFFYGLRNALIPCLTAGGLILGYMLTGAVLIEVTFALPGLGSLLVESVNFKDIPVLQALVMLVAVIVVLVNLGVDLLYQKVDPRIRFDAVA